MPKQRQAAPALPEQLLKEAPSVKLLYVWLSDKGEVNYSQRSIAQALGMEQVAIKNALKTLRRLGFIKDLGEVKERVTARFVINK